MPSIFLYSITLLSATEYFLLVCFPDFVVIPRFRKLSSAINVISFVSCRKSSFSFEYLKLISSLFVLLVFNKKDKADSNQTALWKKHYEAKGYSVLPINAKDSSDIKKLLSKDTYIPRTHFLRPLLWSLE